MARTFISPMGDPTFASAAQNLAEALFPSARTRAGIQMAGAQYQGQLGNNRQTELENVGLEDQNSAWAEGPGATGMSPQDFAIARLGRAKASPDNLGSFIAKQVETRMRQGAAERAGAGDYTGANAQLFGVASGPVAVDQIQSGYRLNPYDTGGGMAATGETLADIAYKQAQAQASQASAGAASALEAQRRDEMANPGKYRSPKTSDISPSESLALDKLVGNYLPPVADGKEELPAQIDPALRNEILSRSAELYRQSGNAQSSVAQAFAELAQQSQAGGEAVPEVDRFDFGTGLRDTPGQPAKPYKFDRRAPAAAPQAQPTGRTVTRTGTLNGRRVVQYSDGAVEYAP